MINLGSKFGGAVYFMNQIKKKFNFYWYTDRGCRIILSVICFVLFEYYTSAMQLLEVFVFLLSCWFLSVGNLLADPVLT